MTRGSDSDCIWWKHGVIYHIYPRSFYDANNDGIGDIKGVMAKLDYLEFLGIDAIWISPVYQSPQNDFGYDVSDYYKIDPVFGSLHDMQKLIKKAHKKGIRVIMDMVLNHTSDKHSWFLESKSGLKNPKREWYIWSKGQSGKAPNNWRTAFGKKGWTFDPNTKQYYYHSFLPHQPDLNWRNPELKKAMFQVMEYWLNQGIDGFRLDVINFIAKDKKFRDNPGFFSRWLINKTVYTRNRNKSVKIVHEIRQLLNKYNKKMCVGELYTLPPGSPGLVKKYLGNGKNRLHLAFDFSLIFTHWRAKNFAKTLTKSLGAVPKAGWPCHVLSNHDLNRSYSKEWWPPYRMSKAKLKAMLLLTLKGTPFIYYGEEIGMENTRIPVKKIRDPLGKMYWPFYKGRDKSRTPMQWTPGQNAGFSKNIPWLPVNQDYLNKNVQQQMNDKSSILWLYKDLIDLRRKSKPLSHGKWKIINTNNNKILAYKRWYKNKMVIVLLNFSNKPQHVQYPFNGKVICSTHNQYPGFDGSFWMLPFEGIVVA